MKAELSQVCGVDVADGVGVSVGSGTGVSVGGTVSVGCTLAVCVTAATTVWTAAVCSAFTSTGVGVGLAFPPEQETSKMAIKSVDAKWAVFM